MHSYDNKILEMRTFLVNKRAIEILSIINKEIESKTFIYANE